MNGYCERCRRFIPIHKRLWWKVPVREWGIRFFMGGYGTCEVSHEICDECYEELRRFWKGEAVEAVVSDFQSYIPDEFVAATLANQLREFVNASVLGECIEIEYRKLGDSWTCPYCGAKVVSV